MVKDVFFFKSSATFSLNEANESSEDNNLTAPLISKSTTFASTSLASDKCVRLLKVVRIFEVLQKIFHDTNYNLIFVVH
jgi:hypothetical protein